MRLRGRGYVCNHIASTVMGQTSEEAACEPGRPHRVLLLQLLPDGVSYAEIRRVGKPALRVRMRNNLVFADPHVPSRAYLPKQTVWRRRGRLHRLGLADDDSLFTCRGPSRGGPASAPAGVLR